MKSGMICVHSLLAKLRQAPLRVIWVKEIPMRASHVTSKMRPMSFKGTVSVLAMLTNLLSGPHVNPTVYRTSASIAPVNSAALSLDAVLSAQRSIEYLRRVMDEYHTRFPVYDDISSPGNHFHSWAKIPATAPVDCNGTWTDNPHSGATSIRCRFIPTQNASPFGGFYFMNGTLQGTEQSPQANWGTVPNAGINLTGATALTFFARSSVAGGQVEFFVGGVGRDPLTGAATSPYPDSSPRHPAQGTRYTLTTEWQLIRIDLTGKDLSYVLGGLGWVADVQHNPSGVEFFLDDIQFELDATRREQRLNEPRFLRSLTLLPLQPDPFDADTEQDIDFVLRNVAFSYDNALVLLAFLAEGSADSIRRARLIGDAFVYATGHDRYYNDNRSCGEAVDPLTPNGARVRTAYSAGDLALPPGWTPNGRVGTVPVPGFYAEATKKFYEVEQEALDSGNNLWVLTALASLFQHTGQASYRNAACKLGNFVHAFRNDSGTYQGFTGGVDKPETTPARRWWGSAEHNLDAHASYQALYDITGDARWRQDALHARAFVDAMWHDGRGCYLAGTTDPNTRNLSPFTVPLDVQAWSFLSLLAPFPRPQAMMCAEMNHVTTSDGFTGADFNDDRDAVWFEGTAQLAVAAMHAGRSGLAEALRAELRRAQQTAPFGDLYGIASASHDGLTTGFLTAGGGTFKYFRRLHIAVASWNVFAQLSKNPYYLETPSGIDADTLPAAWELQFGLNPVSSAGQNGDDGDPDGDGLTNLQELNGGTHPRGSTTRYLAEGATGTFFETTLALLNPGSTPAIVLLRFQKDDATTITHVVNVPAATRRTVAVAGVQGMASASFSTVIESDQLVVVDRTMTWNATGYGSHGETALLSPATTWYLAEGSTSGEFTLFYLLQNPNGVAITATVRYLRPFGLPPIAKDYPLPPYSRTTIPVDGEGPELASTDLSAVVTAPAPIIVERAMYRSTPSETFAAGHASAGVTAPSTHWFLAEGATGPFFDLFILLANPADSPANVRVDYLLSTGETLTKDYVVAANGRFTIPVDAEEFPAGSGNRPLTNVAVSSTITSMNDVPIVVERTMWFPSPELSQDYWSEAHNSAGATIAGTRWAVASGEVGGARLSETFVLIANTSAVSGQARVTLMFEDGTSAQRTLDLLPQSRTTLNVSADVPEAIGKRFGAVIESLGAAPASLVVECAIYTSPNGRTWTAGTNAMGTLLP
jgi:hypothetical protein